MATLTIKNVPDDLYAALKESAKRNRRSLNQEAIAWLADDAAPSAHDRFDVAAALVDEHRERRGIHVDHDLVDQFIDEGRDRRDLMLKAAAGLGAGNDMAGERVGANGEKDEGRDHGRDIALERATAFRKTLEGRIWATEDEIDRFINEGRE